MYESLVTPINVVTVINEEAPSRRENAHFALYIYSAPFSQIQVSMPYMMHD